MLSNLKRDDADRLTKVDLNEDARLAVRCAVEFVLKTGTVELFVSVCLSLAARGYGYDPAFLVCAYVGDPLFGPEPPACLEKLYRANTTLVNEGWMDPVSLETLADRVKSSVCPDPSLVVNRGPDWDEKLEAALADVEDDRLAIAAFPPQSPQDLGIQYVRASDLWSYYRETLGEGELRQTLQQLKNFDYVCITNLLLAKVVFTDPQWWATLQRASCFDGGSEHYRLACKKLSDLVKKKNLMLPADTRVCFYECTSLYGTMCPPVPGWDPIEETEASAGGTG